LGGHCIPIDPFYLTWKAREFDISTRFIELAGEINAAMPQYVVDKLARSLDERAGRGLRGAKILMIGHRLQEERRRHSREPRLQIDRAVGGARRRGRLP
jgi:UDP-N-acetyl-D-glucosamine dehydrogenase